MRQRSTVDICLFCTLCGGKLGISVPPIVLSSHKYTCVLRALPIHSHTLARKHTHFGRRECLFISIKTSASTISSSSASYSYWFTYKQTENTPISTLSVCRCECRCRARASLNWKLTDACLTSFRLLYMLYARTSHTNLLTLYFTAVLMQQYSSKFKLHLFIYTHIH